MATEVPVLDLRTTTAKEFTDALLDASCVLLTGHGISLDVRDGVFSTSRQFFELDTAAKEQCRWNGEGIWCGWQPPGAPDIAGDRLPDLVDRYEVHSLDTYDLWPAGLPELRDVWTQYFDACAALVSRLMDMIIDALELPEALRPAWTDHQFASLLANHYVPQDEEPLPGQSRLHGHSDHGGLTLLTADDSPGGLEVRLPGSNEWLPVKIPHDAVLVQAGDLLSRWTNRLMRGNVHRVVNPPREVAATSRMSVVYFHHPALDTWVEPAPHLVERSGREPLSPLLTGEHCVKRQKSYGVPPDARVGELDALDGRNVPV